MIVAHYTTDEEEKKRVGLELVTQIFPLYMKRFDARIAEHGKNGHIVGDKYTLADFGMGAFLSSVIYNDLVQSSPPLRQVVEQFPNLSLIHI